MSRYLLLFLLNLPFIILALLGAITQYKLNRSTKKRFISQILLWLFVLVGLALAQPVYIWLFQSNLTQTEPLSLFDVIQITAIVIIFYLLNRTMTKVSALEHRLKNLHQEISITLSKEND